jgi:trk system potassium uptake protein TrkH
MSTSWNRTLARLRKIHPVKLLMLGYLSYSLIGWGLLNLPVMHADEPIGVLDNLFIATSAMSTTGLITVNTPLAYSFWGELVIISLIQLGGIGYMTFGSFVVLAGRRKLSAWREGMTRTAFALPEGFKPAAFVRNVVLFTFIVEAIGAVLLYFAFSSAGVAQRGADGEIGASFAGDAHVAWQAIFHSISAFCTAGFSLFPDSLEGYPGNFWINLIVSCLSLCGAIGFIVLSDVWWNTTGRRHHLTLTTKIILQFTFSIILIGAVLLFIADPTLQELPGEERVLVAWFQSMTAATTVGFNTYPIGALGLASVLMMYLIMIVGASPSGTGGGLKSTSISAIYATLKSTLRGQDEITYRGKLIPTNRLHTAYAALGFYVLTLAIGGYLLLVTESRPTAVEALEGQLHSFEDLLFEVTSALGTVGLSRGVTGDLTDLGKLVIIVLMFIGRLGPLTFGLVLFASNDPEPLPDQPKPTEDVAI